jgi:hypothetical protein
MADEIVVREGNLEDFDSCVKLAIAATKENALVAPDFKLLLDHIYACLTKDHGIMGVIGEPGKDLEGMFILRISSMWYSNENILEEKVVYVHPDFRQAKGGRAKKLIEWGKKVSDELNIPMLVGVIANKRTESKIKLYERMFGQPAGVYFVYNGKSGHQEAFAE